ncbi:MAG: ABC transporter substrate-binding protein [Acidimicrobiales bacterium]
MRIIRWLGLAALVAASACGSDAGDTAAVPTTAPGDAVAARCEANKKAGQLTFLTSFDFAAAASILDVVAAKDQGYFQAVCLDVKLQAGFSTSNVPLLAGGKAQMTSLGSFSEVAVANSNGAGLLAVGVLGKTSIEELLVEESSSIRELRQLEGKEMGIKGAIPYSLRAMLAKDGVDESKIKQVEVGFNPVVLYETSIEALPVYKSNEPRQLDAQGYKYRAFDPRQYDVPASFAVYATTKDFARRHPTAVADFLRAALKGFEYATANPDAAVSAALKLSDPKNFFSADGEKFRWKTESELVKASSPADEPLGNMTLDRLQAEEQFLIDLKIIKAGSVDVHAAFDNRFIEEIHDKDHKLIWPPA